MTPAELQEGISRAFREFYSPREGLRRLFHRGPKRFYNCVIRFLGRRLFARIMKETLPHRRALYRLNDWLEAVDELCSSASVWLQETNSKLSEASDQLPGKLDRMCDEMTQAKMQLLETIEQRLQSLKESLESIAESYRPFGRRLLEDLHARFHSELNVSLAPTR
jgi:hypothetical protein